MSSEIVCNKDLYEKKVFVLYRFIPHLMWDKDINVITFDSCHVFTVFPGLS